TETSGIYRLETDDDRNGTIGAVVWDQLFTDKIVDVGIAPPADLQRGLADPFVFDLASDGRPPRTTQVQDGYVRLLPDMAVKLPDGRMGRVREVDGGLARVSPC